MKEIIKSTIDIHYIPSQHNVSPNSLDFTIVANNIKPEIAVGEMLKKQCVSLKPNCINIKKVKHATNELNIFIICASKNPIK